ncbi:MAG: ABC transporter permease [Anaerolineae bacterium]|nr:ABC transporter permease [Anaerolineae bacterium]
MAQLKNEPGPPLLDRAALPAILPRHAPSPTRSEPQLNYLASSWFWGIVGVIVTLLLWQLVATLQLLGPQFGPAFSPLSAGLALIELTGNGVLWPHLRDSLRRVLVGLMFAAGLGIPVGVLIGYYRLADAASGVVFQFLRMISPLAWMPIAIIALGVGDYPIYFLIAVASIWPFILNTAHGVSRVDPLWVRVARNLGAGEVTVLYRVIVPAIIPDILTGLRLAIGMAWVMLVPDEMLGVSSGIGYFILDTRDRFRYDQLMAAILTIGLIGYLLDGLVKTVQRRYSWTIQEDK